VNARSIGATEYKWSVPLGATYTYDEEAQDTIYVTFPASLIGNTFTAEQFSVSVTNGCGTTTGYAPNWDVYRIIGQGQEGDMLLNKYRTYEYPDPIGTWMIDFSKEGNPAATAYPGQEGDVRGYYYLYENAAGACPAGWGLPTTMQMWNFREFMYRVGPGHPGTTPLWDETLYPGWQHVGQAFNRWDWGALMWLDKGRGGFGGNWYWEVVPTRNADLYSVRCVKQN
jgi:hypothetical protein